MFKKLKNSEKFKNLTQKASAAYQKAKNTEIHLGHKIETEPVIIQKENSITESENSTIIDLLCLFAFKYQHRWTKGKQAIIEAYCETVDDNNYFTQLRLAEEHGYTVFEQNHAKQLFSEIRIAHTATSFDHWAEFQQKLITDILHLLALSGCSAEEIQRENLHLSSVWSIGEEVCQQAFSQQQTAQSNNETPYNQ